jgi:hypothetical protein
MSGNDNLSHVWSFQSGIAQRESDSAFLLSKSPEIYILPVGSLMQYYFILSTINMSSHTAAYSTLISILTITIYATIAGNDGVLLLFLLNIAGLAGLAMLFGNRSPERYAKAFIIVMIIVWILFLNAVPYDLNTNKASVMEYIPDTHKPFTAMYSPTHTLGYPLILKPAICSRISKGVKIIRNKKEEDSYFTEYDPKETVIQEYIPYANEVGILYERHLTNDDHGSIVSIAVKESSNKIKEGCRNGVTCIDRTSALNSPKLNNVVDSISRKIPHFYLGRYDVLYENEDELRDGNFYIVEANAQMGFDLRSLVHFERWFFARTLMGLKNMLKGRGYSTQSLLRLSHHTVSNCITCRDWEKIFSCYT